MGKPNGICTMCSGPHTGSHISYCRDCYNAYKRASYSRNREKEIARSLAWNKANPEKHRANQKKHWASDKYKASFKAWRAANKDKTSLYDKQKRAKRRGSIGSDRVTLTEWNEIKAKHKNCCAYCHKKCKALTMDHIIPLVKGGRHIAQNIAPACRLCNNRKTFMDAHEFAQKKLGRLL